MKTLKLKTLNNLGGQAPIRSLVRRLEVGAKSKDDAAAVFAGLLVVGSVFAGRAEQLCPVFAGTLFAGRVGGFVVVGSGVLTSGGGNVGGV